MCLRGWNLADTPEPWKPHRSLILTVPGAACPSRIRIDLAHTWAIGVGKDFCASSIVVLCRLGFFGTGAIPKRLEKAHEHFREWCYFAKEHVQLKDFSFNSLKIQSFLGYHNLVCFFFSTQ